MSLCQGSGEFQPLTGFLAAAKIHFFSSYGLPLSRLYARYFQGDVKVASYENHGTDVYIYLRALAKESVEKLPIWNEDVKGKISATSSNISDWVGQAKKMSTKSVGRN